MVQESSTCYLFWAAIAFCLLLLRIISILYLERAQYFQWIICFSPLLEILKLGQITIYSTPSISLVLGSSHLIQSKISLCALNRKIDYLVLCVIIMKFDLDFLDPNCFKTGQLGNIFLIWFLIKCQSILPFVKISDTPAKFLIPLAPTTPNIHKLFLPPNDTQN